MKNEQALRAALNEFGYQDNFDLTQFSRVEIVFSKDRTDVQFTFSDPKIVSIDSPTLRVAANGQ